MKIEQRIQKVIEQTPAADLANQLRKTLELYLDEALQSKIEYIRISAEEIKKQNQSD